MALELQLSEENIIQRNVYVKAQSPITSMKVTANRGPNEKEEE